MLGLSGAPLLEALVPLGPGLTAAVEGLAGVRENLVRDLEGLLRVEAQDALGGRDLVLAERRAVRGLGVLRVGAGQAMIERIAMNDGLSVTFFAAWIAL